MLDSVHDEVSKRLQPEKENQHSLRVACQQAAEDNSEVHGDNSCVREEHHRADIRHSRRVPFPVVPVRERMIDQKHKDTQYDRDKRLALWKTCALSSSCREKAEVYKVEEPIMQQEEPRGLSFGCCCRFHRLIIDLEILGGELLEIEDSFEIEQPDDNALPPIDQHDLADIPALDDREQDRNQIGENQKRSGSIRPELLGDVHLMIIDRKRVQPSLKLC